MAKGFTRGKGGFRFNGTIYGHVRRNEEESYEAQSEAWWAEMPTQPSASRKTKDNTFISALVSSGVYSELDVLFVRGTEYQDINNTIHKSW
jgi:hypothetical protein